jgi:hypothetical protein
MNCEIIQRRLLGVENPARPPAELQAHLDSCGACRDWQGRLLQVETNIPRLPVPASETRDVFLRSLTAPAAGPAVATVKQATPPPPTRVPPGQKPMPVVRLNLDAHREKTSFSWRYVVGGAAAAVLLFVFANWALRDPSTPTPLAKDTKKQRAPADPLVANLMQRNLKLIETNSAPERVQTLALMSEDLHRESVALAKTDGADELVQHLSRLRVQVTESMRKLEKDGKELTVAPHGPVATPVAIDTQRVTQLKRNQGLIQSLVEGGLRLAMESDMIRRADSCNALAKSLASEVRSAASDRDGDRAIEMGTHLRELLQYGVAKNLGSVRKNTPQGSVGEQDLLRIRDWVTEIARPLEEQLRLAADSDRDLDDALKAVRRGRTEVENAVRVS